MQNKEDEEKDPGKMGKGQVHEPGKRPSLQSREGCGSGEDASGIPALALLPKSVAGSHHTGKRREGAQLALLILLVGRSSSANLRRYTETIMLLFPTGLKPLPVWQQRE